MTTVLVTRPEPGASATAKKLLSHGFAVHRLPLTETVSLPYKTPEVDFDAVIVTSSQALAHLEAGLLNLPLYAVGEASARAALQAGFQTVVAGGGDVARLTALICSTLPASSRLLYLCGKVRRPDLETALTDFALTVVETYDTQLVDLNGIALPHLDLVMLTSVQSAAQCSRLLSLPQNQAAVAGAHFLCLSQRIADGLEGVKREFIHIAAQPDEDSLLNLAIQLGN